MAYLDALDNFPRNKISNQLMKFILTMLDDLGIANAPSLKGSRKVQKTLEQKVGIKQVESVNSSHPEGGSIFVNDPKDIISADWTNPRA